MSKATEQDFFVISRGKWDKAVSKEDIQEAIDDFYVCLDRSIHEGKMKMGSRSPVPELSPSATSTPHTNSAYASTHPNHHRHHRLGSSLQSLESLDFA